MSSINTGRIKQIRKRTGNKLYTSIPIGADGILIDMLSELDLEEEIKLGGNHYVDIILTNTATEIREWYFSEPRRNRTISEMSQYVTYSISVNMIFATETTLGETQQDGTFITLQENGDFIVVRLAISSNELRIEIKLYKNDMNTQGNRPIHSKIIYIYEDPLTNKLAIDEQVDYDGNINNPLTLEGSNG